MDFYILPAGDAGAARLRFACRLAEKAYHLKHRVHLHTGSAAAAAELDELLWTFRQGSFVPHEIFQGRPGTSPVTIGHGPDRPPDADLLVNLSPTLPEFTPDFPRVAEIVEASDEGRERGRQNFRQYRQYGREMVTHNIGGES